jgi:hypothetical protein
MECHEVDRCLELGMDGELPSGAVEHLSQCPRCQGVVSDLAAIHVAARELAATEVSPPEGIWVSLRVQLESEGLIRVSRADRAAEWAERWWGMLRRPAIAGVMASLLVVVIVLVAYFRHRWRDQPSQESETASVVGFLQKDLTAAADRTVSAMHARDPAINASLRQNLRTVDDLIVLCEKSVRENPQSELGREYLYGAYQQKAYLLAVAADSNRGGDE